jgi:hypothetical protein
VPAKLIEAILSVSLIRYRYSRVTAVHSTDFADQSGNPMTCSPPDAWRQAFGQIKLNNKSHNTPHVAQQSRDIWGPDAESGCGDRSIVDPVYRTERWLCPLTGCMRDTDSSPSFNQLLMTTPPCRQGYCMEIVMLLIRLPILMYTTTSPSHPQVDSHFPIEQIMLPIRPPTILVFVDL